MAAHPIVAIDDDLLEKLPKPYNADPRYQKGAALDLVAMDAGQSPLSVEETLRRWDSLRGISSDPAFDANAELEEEKQRELAKEARWIAS